MNPRFSCGSQSPAARYMRSRSIRTSLLQPPVDTWPTYNGDYSGRRFSTLSKINSQNVQSLSLAWIYRTSAATGTFGNVVKSTPLMVDGVLYFSIPDHVFAIDARSGQQIWQFNWASKGGWHLGNRGVGMYGNWLYFETPDCNLVSLNSKDGTERWHKQICDLDRFYTATRRPCRHRQSRDRRRKRRRSRHSWISRIPRSRNRRCPVALVFGPQTRRAWF